MQCTGLSRITVAIRFRIVTPRFRLLSLPSTTYSCEKQSRAARFDRFIKTPSLTMSSPAELNSSSHLSTLISTHPLTIIDFHATWCGPCHAIAPFYTSLSQKHSSPNRIIFTKCDVDAQSSIARTYSVTAMPTFIILHQGKEVARVRGADRTSLGREVEKWVQEVGGAKRAGFTGSGQALGGEKPTPSVSASGSGRPSYIRGGEAMASVPLDARLGQWVEWVTMVIVLYFVSLLSLDPWGACEGVEPQGGGRRGWGAVARGFFGGGGGGGGGPGGPGGGRPGGRKLGGMDTIPGAGRTVSGVNTGSCCG